MMTSLCCEVLKRLKGKTLVTAESCTGGGIGAALTAISGSSRVFKGGIISDCNEVKETILGVDGAVLREIGPVSEEVAVQMAQGAKRILAADVAVSVTGLAGSEGDEYGNPPGCVCIGYCDERCCVSQRHYFHGDRESVRTQAITAALRLVLNYNP